MATRDLTRKFVDYRTTAKVRTKEEMMWEDGREVYVGGWVEDGRVDV